MNRSHIRCYLHIGAPKTGTVALQKFLTSNRGLLSQHGFSYPSGALRGFGHHDLAFLAGGGYPEWATPQDKSLDTLVEEIRAEINGDPNTLILSSENFYLLCPPLEAARLLGSLGFQPGIDVAVIVYIRRQDETHLSWYNQMVKAQGYSGDIADSIASHHELWDYAARLGAWSDVFGKDNMLVRSYHSGASSGEDIRRDFTRLLDFPEASLDYPDERPNTRINREILEFQRRVNRLPLSQQEKRRFHKELMALTAATADTGLFCDTPLLDREQRKKILSQYAISNRNVAEVFFGRSELFDEMLPEEGATAPGGEELTLEKLSYILGWIMARRENG